VIRLILLVALGYLCGSIPSGVWFARRHGVDVRRSGSGNIGATNVARTAGAGPAILTLLLDVLKGFVPTGLAMMALPSASAVVLVGLAAVLGHLFPVFLGFSGGKGVATAFGVFLALAPAGAAVSATVFVAVALTTRYASLASMLAAVALAPACAWLGASVPIWLGAAAIAAMIIARHRDNIGRLLRHEEPKFRAKSS
jgi:glycerol-3-phosphate acyltransferase PlsY